MQIIHADALTALADIPDASIDMVLTDPPYGTTACKWDTIIPFVPMWEQLKRVTKANGAIVLFGSQPFTSALVMSNVDMFKYEWVWEKSRTVGFLNAKNAPLKRTESILIFSSGATANNNTNRMCYFPQGLVAINELRSSVKQSASTIIGSRPSRNKDYVATHTGYPDNILRFKNEKKQVHPTQKPVALCEYLIRTYTNTGETVLDFTMGSGTTGVACVKTGRKFIGIEKDNQYYEIARKRIADAQHEMSLLGV